MSYTIEDYRRELKERALKMITPEEILKAFPAEEILKRLSVEEIRAYLKTLPKKTKPKKKI